MKVAILAQAFNPQTGQPLAPAREEIIDLATNKLFKGKVRSLHEIHEIYEAFWNQLDGYSNNKEIVLVQSIRRL